MAQRRKINVKRVVMAALCVAAIITIIISVAVLAITKKKVDSSDKNTSKPSKQSTVSIDSTALSSGITSSTESSEPASSVTPSSSAQSISSRNSSSKAVSSSAASASTGGALTVSAFVGQTNDWRLLLANRNNLVSNYAPATKAIPRENCQDSQDYRFDERAWNDLMDMINSAQNDGVKLIVVSSYRKFESQQRLYNRKVQYYKNKGYGDSKAKELAATVVAVPGTSDHGLGLGVDFNYLSQSYENTKELTWLRNNAGKFGFVIRYPKNKESVTGVIYEPWHYRYVGKDNAEIMNKNDYCLEEYVEKLVSGK